jgi:hypothetical protein
MNKFIDIFKFIMWFIWQLPQNIVALLMIPFIGKLKLVEYKKYCYAFEAKYMQGAISLGNFIFLSRYSSKVETTIAHEYGHVDDSKLFGWFYIFIIGLPSILNACFNFTECYYDFWTEKRANKNAGLGVNSRCRLYFLNKEEL